MSRIGKKVIQLPSNVTLKIEGSKVTVTGPKGTLVHTFNDQIKITQEGQEVKVTRPNDSREMKAQHKIMQDGVRIWKCNANRIRRVKL